MPIKRTSTPAPGSPAPTSAPVTGPSLPPVNTGGGKRPKKKNGGTAPAVAQPAAAKAAPERTGDIVLAIRCLYFTGASCRGSGSEQAIADPTTEITPGRSTASIAERFGYEEAKVRGIVTGFWASHLRGSAKEAVRSRKEVLAKVQEVLKQQLGKRTLHGLLQSLDASRSSTSSPTMSKTSSLHPAVAVALIIAFTVIVSVLLHKLL